MTQPLVILGASGNTLDIIDLVAAANAISPHWRLVGVLDDGDPAAASSLGVPVLGGLDQAQELGADIRFVLAIGSERSHLRRAAIIGRTGLPESRFATLVHPAAAVSPRAAVAAGCVVGFGCSVAGRATLGPHAWLGPCCIVGHDSVLRAHAVMAPRATVSGSVTVGEAAYLGSGSIVRQNLSVGARALIGLGAVVIRDVPDDAVVAGNPARLIRQGGPPG